MAKKNRPAARPDAARSRTKPHVSNTPAQGNTTTMKDLLKSDVLQKLQAQADELKAEAAAKLEAERRQKEAARKAEQERLDNDFAHLLEHTSQDWRKYK